MAGAVAQLHPDAPEVPKHDDPADEWNYIWDEPVWFLLAVDTSDPSYLGCGWCLCPRGRSRPVG